MKVAVFYHVYQHEDWLSLFKDQFGLLKSSGLFDAADHIHLGVNGETSIESSIVRVEVNPNPLMEESDTLKSLLAYANENDAKILYMHTKGISRPSQEMTDWRNMMEYFCIEGWQECIDLLDKHDAVGCNFMDDCHYGFYPHFSGNFWWANSEHIRGLNHSYLDMNDDPESRVFREFWIGSNGGNFYQLHNSGIKYHGVETYPSEKYRVKTFQNEEPHLHWPGVNVQDRTVLDLGAGDFGRVGEQPYPATADYWIANGATKVVAVDMEERDLENYTDPRIEKVVMSISGPDDISSLIQRHQPDLVKSDIEGAEAYLFNVPSDILKIPKAYAIETHNPYVFENISIMLKRLGYSTVWSMQHEIESSVSVIYAERIL